MAQVIPSLTRSVDVSISEFSDDDVRKEAYRRAIFTPEDEAIARDPEVITRRRDTDLFNLIERVLEEIKRFRDLDEAVLLLERERDRVRPPVQIEARSAPRAA